MAHRMKEWRNDDCEHSWISHRPMMDSDWPVWFILRVEYMDQHMSDDDLKRFGGKYCVSILAVSPDAVSPEEMKSAFDCIGSPMENASNDLKIEALVSYGIYATLHSEATNNKAASIKAAREQLRGLTSIMFGFAMDRAQNRIGDTGWDFIKGDIGFKATA